MEIANLEALQKERMEIERQRVEIANLTHLKQASPPESYSPSAVDVSIDRNELKRTWKKSY